ncbi:MAG: chorismate mutase [Anaerolineae bacterium]|nr:chorismate mutase [Anaerolineae bacterium]HNS39250.1 chorismate mutase [Promineifilum sp.]
MTNSSDNGQERQNVMMCRGVRGAITVSGNDENEILDATRELLLALVAANGMHVDDIASVYFTTTSDLTATYPAYAARQLGWYDAALLCGHEMEVPGSLTRCIRVLIHWNTTKSPGEISHIYLREARSLRPDRKNMPPIRPRQMSPVEAAVKFLSMTL